MVGAGSCRACARSRRARARAGTAPVAEAVRLEVGVREQQEAAEQLRARLGRARRDVGPDPRGGAGQRRAMVPALEALQCVGHVQLAGHRHRALRATRPTTAWRNAAPSARAAVRRGPPDAAGRALLGQVPTREPLQVRAAEKDPARACRAAQACGAPGGRGEGRRATGCPAGRAPPAPRGRTPGRSLHGQQHSLLRLATGCSALGEGEGPAAQLSEG